MSKAQNKPSVKCEVYQKLKLWDKKRAQILRNHKKASQQIFQAIQIKIEDSKYFLRSLQTILQQRVNQLKVYCNNSILDSELVFEKNKNESYSSHHELLKQIYNFQASNTKQSYQKLNKMAEVLKQFKDAVGQSNEQGENVQPYDQDKNDESSLVIAKGDIKFLLQCQLPEIVQKVVLACQKVSKIYNENIQKDLYFTIQQFIRLSYKQTNKHREIGRALISYTSASVKRQIRVQNRIRQCLRNWAQIDGPIDNVFVEQLMKKDQEVKIKDFYNIQQLSDIDYNAESLQDFIINFKIDHFTEHQRLKLCDLEGVYNDKIQTGIIVTVDCYLHLLRLNAYQPDFSIKLNSQLSVRKIKQATLQFVQYKKKYYFKKEKQFQFKILFNSEENLHYLRTIVEKISQCKFQ